MSTDPQGLGEKPFTPKNYINFKLTKEIVCCYQGNCRIDDVISDSHDTICSICNYRIKLNVPKILDELVNKSIKKINKGD